MTKPIVLLAPKFTFASKTYPIDRAHHVTVMAPEFPQSWNPWIQQIQTSHFSDPVRTIEAARKLLKICQSDDHLAYVYEQLGFAHLLLGEHRLSCVMYEQSLNLKPNNMYALANMAHALYELGVHGRAVSLGRRALQIKDDSVRQATFPRAMDIQPPHQGKLNLISYSLYGQQARYCEMAILNVLAARLHLPDFICRFYLDESVPHAIVTRLQKLGGQCISMSSSNRQIPPTMWRFLAMDDESADYVLVRDVDSLIDAREALSIEDWRTSGLPFHIIRDDCCHTELILAGLFGIRSGTLRGIRQRIDQYIMHTGSSAWERYADQLFLRQWIWPGIRMNSLTHDRIYGYGSHVKPSADINLRVTGPRNSFIGANYSTGGIRCELEQSVPDNSMLCLSLTTASGKLICRYPMRQVTNKSSDNRTWEITLPQLYAQNLQCKHWQQNIAIFNIESVTIGEGSIDPVEIGLVSGH